MDVLFCAETFYKAAQASLVVPVKDLDPALKNALKRVNYGGRDITVKATDTFSPRRLSSGDGQRSFTMAVNLATGESQLEVGDWGGANIFTQKQVDLDDREQPLPPGFAIIQGSMGHHNFASILINPANMIKLLPSTDEVTDRQKRILYEFRALKSSYRRKWPSQEIDELIAKGLLKRNSAGAVSITTAGKNAVGNANYY